MFSDEKIGPSVKTPFFASFGEKSGVFIKRP
jgi:hypothetical protein